MIFTKHEYTNPDFLFFFTKIDDVIYIDSMYVRTKRVNKPLRNL